MPPAALTRAREVLQRLERYELDVFAEEETTAHVAAHIERAATAGAGGTSGGEDQALSKAATRAARRRLAAQSSLFDLANQKVVEELRETDPEDLSPEEAKQLLNDLRKQIL